MTTDGRKDWERKNNQLEHEIVLYIISNEYTTCTMKKYSLLTYSHFQSSSLVQIIVWYSDETVTKEK